MKAVSEERWVEAQTWEEGHWDRYVKRAKSLRELNLVRFLVKRMLFRETGDDSNLWWKSQFDEYRFLPEKLKNIVEFGCGPFTNLRLIVEGRQIRYIFASDPLAKTYITYRGFHLAKKWRNGEYLIDNHPLEEAPFADAYFDATICINVLDHVRDPDACLKQLVRVTMKGGILVFGQDLTCEEDLIATKVAREKTSDVGHPHTFLDEVCLKEYLERFETIIEKRLERKQGRAPGWHVGTFIFAGRKLG